MLAVEEMMNLIIIADDTGQKGYQFDTAAVRMPFLNIHK
jgi:hypothetical protein